MQVSGDYIGYKGLHEVLKMREEQIPALSPNVRKRSKATSSEGRCVFCRAPLPKGRKDMSYCGQSCRQQAYLKRKAA
jgi:hypothetical protein